LGDFLRLLNFLNNPLENGTFPEFDKIACDKLQLEISFGAVKLDELKLGNPSFLTEFGVCAYQTNEDDDESKLNTEECESVLDATDRYFQSWTYWDSKFYYKRSQQTINDLVNIFSRVYPMATNGVPIKMHYNTTSKDFFFNYQLNATTIYQGAYVPTEIFIPAQVYPSGFNVNVSSHLKWLYDRKKSIMYVLLIDNYNIWSLSFSENSNKGFFDSKIFISRKGDRV